MPLVLIFAARALLTLLQRINYNKLAGSSNKDIAEYKG